MLKRVETFFHEESILCGLSLDMYEHWTLIRTLLQKGIDKEASNLTKSNILNTCGHKMKICGTTTIIFFIAMSSQDKHRNKTKV